MGYLFALLNIYFTYAGRAGGNSAMLSYEDIVAGYSGSGKGSVLESALSGPMSTMLPNDERSIIIRWAHEGASEPVYDMTVKPIVEKRCFTCHDGRNPHLPNFTSFEGVKKVTAQDTGASIATLVRVSHIHLFGITFIFFIVGLAFSHAYVRPIWFKCSIIALPFFAIVVDVSSWYLIKLYHPFAWVEIGAGMTDGGLFRGHVADVSVPDVVLETARSHSGPHGRRHSDRVTRSIRSSTVRSTAGSGSGGQQCRS